MSFFNALLPTRDLGAPASVRRPQYRIAETAEAYDLTVNLPGVAREGVEITDEDGQLTVSAKPSPTPEGRTLLRRESPDAPFELVLQHDDAVDAEKIAAGLKDGVLSLRLPKAESAKPRKISVA
ncbi:MAG TPA: Hsp20/alpha crystallin family protein [Opitutaceae bacterium]|jgi:HSP20 family molecular chaperone IbpA